MSHGRSYPLDTRIGPGSGLDPVLGLVAVLLLISGIQALRMISEAQMTVGDIVAVVTPIILSALFVGWRAWRKKHPFVLKFCDQPFNISAKQESKRTYRNTKTIKSDGAYLALVVETRVSTDASPFGIRFVERSWICGRWRDASGDVVRIDILRVPDWERQADIERDFTGPNNVTVEPDGQGGLIVATRLPKRWVVGTKLWIELTIESKKPWSGYLSFEGQTDRRAFARRRVKIRPPSHDRVAMNVEHAFA